MRCKNKNDKKAINLFLKNKTFINNNSISYYKQKIKDLQLKYILINNHRNRGALGIAECDYLIKVVESSIKDKIPICFFINSSGIDLKENSKLFTYVQKLFKSLFLADFIGIKIITFTNNYCYGGASLILFLGFKTIYFKSSRVGLNSPKLFSKMGKKRQLEEIYKNLKIKALIPNSFYSKNYIYIKKNIYNYIKKNKKYTISSYHRLLKKRLLITRSFKEKYFIENNSLNISDKEVGANDLWQISNIILHYQDNSLIINVIELFHSTKLIDEKLIISQYLIHLAKCIIFKRREGLNIVLNVEKELFGGILVVFSSSIRQIKMSKSAKINFLPEYVKKKII